MINRAKNPSKFRWRVLAWIEYLLFLFKESFCKNVGQTDNPMLQVVFLQPGINFTSRSFSIEMSWKRIFRYKVCICLLRLQHLFVIRRPHIIIWYVDTIQHIDTKNLWLALGREKYLLDKFYRQVAGLSIRPILYHDVTVVFVFWIVM